MGNSVGQEAYNIKLTEENKLGEGPFAQVYKIKRKQDGQLCAAKIFKIPLSAMNSQDKKGYQSELKFLKEAKHPFVIEYFEEFTLKNKNLCIVSKFSSGGDFEKFMNNQKSFTEDEALEYFTMILLSLDFLHSKNIVHNNLKPSNIFIDELADGKKILQIGDFDISKIDLHSMK